MNVQAPLTSSIMVEMEKDVTVDVVGIGSTQLDDKMHVMVDVEEDPLGDEVSLYFVYNFVPIIMHDITCLTFSPPTDTHMRMVG